jgi:DHA1 family tetracycline resistance protein-like MFS transporter
MKPRKAAVIFIFITVTLDMLALGLIAPVLPKLVLNFLGGDTPSAAKMFGIFGTVFALMQFVFSPVLGVLSDRFGRRPVILLSNLGLGLDYIVMALAPTLGWLFLGRVISGITAASISTGTAYVSDVVAPEKRAGAFGMIGAAFGVGFVLGPALGGLLGNSDPRLPFWVAGGLSLANALYGFLVLPESLPSEKRQAFTLRRANPVGALVLLRSHPELFQLATIQFIGYVAHEVFNVWALYTIFRYGWKEGTIGLSLALVGACSIVISAGLVKPIVSRLGERRMLYVGQFFGALGMVLAGLARTSLFFFLSIPVMMLWTISSPAAQGMMTRRVNESEQGELQGAISSLASLAWIIGPGLFTLTFAFFIDQRHGWNIPGAPWYLGGFLLFVAMALATRIPRLPAGTKPVAVVPPVPLEVR